MLHISPPLLCFLKEAMKNTLQKKGFALYLPKYREGLNNLSKAVNLYALMYSFNTNALQGERFNPGFFVRFQRFSIGKYPNSKPKCLL